MSNDEGIREDEVTRSRLFVIWALSLIRHSSFVIRISSLILPTPPGIGYRGKALAKFSLLTRGFPLLIRLACLLLGTRT
jgi:hypothetical protein